MGAENNSVVATKDNSQRSKATEPEHGCTEMGLPGVWVAGRGPETRVAGSEL